MKQIPIYIILVLLVIGVLGIFSNNSNDQPKKSPKDLYLNQNIANDRSVENARDKFINDWNKLIGTKSEITSDTIVVYVNNKTNRYSNKEDYANEYHPKLVNGQSCRELGIKYIQVRNRYNNEMLSGIVCKDK